MADGTSPLTRCGIDTVEIARVERLLLTASPWRRRMARGHPLRLNAQRGLEGGYPSTASTA